MSNYPKEVLAYTLLDWRDYYRYSNDPTPIFEIIGINSQAKCLKARVVGVKKRNIVWLMRGDLVPLTSNAKEFLESCL